MELSPWSQPRFIEDPAVAFPEGLLVSGRIVAAESSGSKGGAQDQQPRLEMTLRCGGCCRYHDARAELISFVNCSLNVGVDARNHLLLLALVNIIMLLLIIAKPMTLSQATQCYASRRCLAALHVYGPSFCISDGNASSWPQPHGVPTSKLQIGLVS